MLKFILTGTKFNMPKGRNQKFKLYRIAQIMLKEIDEESYGINHQLNVKEETWKAVEATHHSLWFTALKEHKEKTAEMINYKEARLRTSHIARMQSLEDALRNNSGKIMFR